jgi:hypothetical protein
MINQFQHANTGYYRHSRINTEPKPPTLKPEQLEEVVEAIQAGKYSWACVLLLQNLGKNPMEHIPYRTFHRLQKENLDASNA